MSNRMIIISREFGSGGGTIGKTWQNIWEFPAMIPG